MARRAPEAPTDDLAAAEWLTTSQVSHALNVSTSRVYQLAAAGRLEVRRTPLGRLFSAAGVTAFLEARKAAQ